jgi:hypothetical protein
MGCIPIVAHNFQVAMEIRGFGLRNDTDLTEQRKMLMLLTSLLNAVKRYVAPQESIAGE